MEVHTVFFSYARADSEFALKLANDLRASGHKLWVDQLDITPGQRWDTEIEKALLKCPYLLVILTPKSVASNNVLDEISYSLEEGKRVIPILLQECVIPFRIKRIQYIDFTKDYENGLNNLGKLLNATTQIFSDDRILSTEIEPELPEDRTNANLDKTERTENLLEPIVALENIPNEGSLISKSSDEETGLKTSYVSNIVKPETEVQDKHLSLFRNKSFQIICALTVVLIIIYLIARPTTDPDSTTVLDTGKTDVKDTVTYTKYFPEDKQPIAKKTSPVTKKQTSPVSKNLDNQKDLLIAKSDCFTCHKLWEASIGPAYGEIAKKYDITEANQSLLAHRIIKGSRGVWGEVPMTAHPNLSKEDALQMVKNILLLAKKNNPYPQ